MDEWRGRLREWTDRAQDAVDRLVGRLQGDRTRAGERAPGLPPGREIDADAAVVTATREDDVASIVGRIDVADAPEVILVVRNEARALRRATAWPHVSAHVRRRGIVLAVVSSRRDVRTFARQNGLRVASSVGALYPSRYVLRIAERDYTVPPVPWGRLVRAGMIIAVLTAAFIVGCFEVPSATVTLVPEAEPVEARGEARPNALIQASDAEDGVISANNIRRQIHTAVTTDATGETEVGDQRASVELQFANSGATVFEVPQNTRVQDADGIAFTTNDSIDVPPGESATVAATAVEPGVPGNVAAEALTELADLPNSITVTNPAAGTGGTNRPTPAVTQEDIDRVRLIADQILQRIAANTLAEEVGEGTLIPGTVNIAIFSEVPVQDIGEAADFVVVEYVVTASALVVPPSEAVAYGAALIRAELDEGMALIPGSVTAEVLAPDQSGADLTILATGRVAELDEITAVAEELSGKTISDARSHLQENLDLVEPPVVEVNPTFIPWLWLPRRANRIEVVIAGPSAPPEEATATPTPTATPARTITPVAPGTDTPAGASTAAP